MATTNPYALTDYESFWNDGYREGHDRPGALFGKPPDEIPDDARDKWKEGWKAGKADAKAGVTYDPEASVPSPAESSQMSSESTEPGEEYTSHDRLWTFTIKDRKIENVTTVEAQKALGKVVAALARTVDYYRDYQKDFDANGSIMNFIIETAPGGRYQPDEAVYAELDSQLNDIRTEISNGDIGTAVAHLHATSEQVDKAGKAWVDFLDHFDRGGKNTVAGLGGVVKLSITVEIVAATALTGGGAAAGAGIGGAGSGLNEAVDEWIGVSTGEKKEFSWSRIGEEALIGTVLGAAGGALEGKWAEYLAEQAPALVGADTALLQKISATFIDAETGEAMTATQLAVKLEPLWGKVVTKLPVSAIKGALHALALKGIGGEADEKTVAQTIGSDISDDAWQLAIEQTLEEVGLIK